MHIVSVPIPDRRAALERVFLHFLPLDEAREQIQLILRAEASGELDVEGIWDAQREKIVVGTIFGYAMPGRQATAFPAYLADLNDLVTADRLHEKLDTWLRHKGSAVAQAVLPVDQGLAAKQLQRAGYRFIAELRYLVAWSTNLPTKPPDTPLNFHPISDADFGRLATVVQATYEQSLDCPEMEDYRKLDDVLDGYRGTATVPANHWYIVTSDDKDVGCVMLNKHEPNHWELTYMGLIPEARGRQWGRDVTRYALWLCRKQQGSELVLAVDAKNSPALAMYVGLGLEEWQRRSVFIKSLEC